MTQKMLDWAADALFEAMWMTITSPSWKDGLPSYSKSAVAVKSNKSIKEKTK